MTYLVTVLKREVRVTIAVLVAHLQNERRNFGYKWPIPDEENCYQKILLENGVDFLGVLDRFSKKR